MNLQKMMQQAQQMQQKMADLQARMEAHEVEGVAGGGAVKVQLNGKHQLLKVDIDPAMLSPNEKEVLEDLIVVAYHQAKDKIDSALADQMGALTGGMNLPPGFKLPF